MRSVLIRSTGILAGLLLLSATAVAEPLAYVSRPDRGDVALIDLSRRVVLGGTPAPARPHSVDVSADGRSVWIGDLDDQTTTLRTLDTRTTTLPALFGVTDVLFRDDLGVAYVARQGAGVAEVDAATGAVLRELPAPDAEQLVFVPGEPAIPGQTGGKPDLLVARTRDELVTLDLSTGGVLTAFSIGSVPARIGRLGDRLVVAQGSRVDLVPSRSGQGVAVRTIPLAGSAVALVVDEARSRLYVAIGSGAVQPVCASCLPAVAEPPIDVSSLELVTDLALSADGGELYVLGRRALGFVDTASDAFEEQISVRAGGGQLGQITVAAPIPPCHPRSTSILAARSEVQEYATSGNTRFKLRARLQDVRLSLLADDPAQAQKDLKNLVGTIDWRTGLDPSEPNHLLPADAERLLCTVGHLKARITAACTATPTCDGL